MSNISLSISVPDEMKDIIMQRTKQGYFGTPSEYLRHLVRQDIQKGQDIQQMENYLNEGVHSGKSRNNPKEIFNKAKKLIATK